jgi:hypothetical protein
MCDRLYTQRNVSLFGSEKGISCCKNNGVHRRSQQQCDQFLQVNGRHLQVTEQKSVHWIVSVTVQEFVF